MKPVFKQNISPEQLYPFTSLNEIIDLRLGILTIKEKWTYALKVYPHMQIDVDIPDNLIPDIDLFTRLLDTPLSSLLNDLNLKFLLYPWDLFKYNIISITSDFKLLSQDRSSADFQSAYSSQKKDNIFIEKDATVQALFLDASEGPIYIGREANIMPGSILKGPISIGNNAVVKMGTCIYQGTSIGPYCTVGGEIKNSNVMDFSNKAHHGYLGDSVIGKWCNLGAGTSVSNLKNNTSIIRSKNPRTGSEYEVGQKCGLMMGDFSKSSINSSFNSGSMVGICANVLHSGVLLPKFIPDFSWGDSNDTRYEIKKLIIDITKWMALKRIEPDKQLIENIMKEYNK
ncbi:MAG: glucose-1-phosphate thymidylyltransferase [Chitinophagaceae bacterium]